MLAKSSPAVLMLSADGTVVVSWYYRAMGATVGKDTWLPSDLDVGNYDNLIIGSNVTIGGGCSVGSPYIAPAGLAVSALQPAYFACANCDAVSTA
jgi:acetyltransferase-like isoleucine patch superfamily enzyme